MYTASPQVPLISPYKGLSQSLIFSTFSTVHTLYSLSFSLTLTHAITSLFILSAILHSSGCNELSALAQEALTEVFIKNADILKVARTGKSHSFAVPLWSRREGEKATVQLCYTTMYHRLIPAFCLQK